MQNTTLIIRVTRICTTLYFESWIAIDRNKIVLTLTDLKERKREKFRWVIPRNASKVRTFVAINETTAFQIILISFYLHNNFLVYISYLFLQLKTIKWILTLSFLCLFFFLIPRMHLFTVHVITLTKVIGLSIYIMYMYI